RLEPFRSCFTGPTFRHVLVLVTGAILTPARRTVTATLSVVGLSQAPTFTNYHRVLNRNRWCSREVARRLLRLRSRHAVLSPHGAGCPAASAVPCRVFPLADAAAW